jgi:signal transduction histidine kinase
MDFLRYARPAPLRRVPVRPSSLLDSCLTLLAPVVEQKHAVVTHRFPPDERDVTADPDQLRQVFLNLLLNALQAIPHSGRIELSLTQSGAETRVSVRDNGPGIPADRLAQVCEPFFTTREGGTGLGLAVARRIVSDHDGRLDIRSPAGQVESTLVGQEDPTRGVSATVVLPTRGR